MAKQRNKANGEGSIYKNTEKGVWVAQITVGKNAEGKPIRKAVTGKTKLEASQKLDKIKADMNIIDILKADEYTVESWIYYYLENVAKNNLSETSYISYKRNLETHIISNFGGYKLSELSPILIQEVYSQKFQDGTLNRTTMKYVHNKFSLAMKYAVKQSLIIKNPCEGVVINKLREAKEIKVLSVVDQKKLVDYCYQDPFNYLFIFLLGTGLRIGEALGLTWDCVDMEDRTITIKKIMVEVHGNPKFSDSPKTESSVRTLALSGKMYAILEEQLKLRSDENHLDLVFPSTTFNFRTTANLRRRFMLVCNAAGIEYINLHALRHTFATRMLEQDVAPKIVSQMLGHKSIVTTLNIYSHVLKENQQEHILKIDDFV